MLEEHPWFLAIGKNAKYEFGSVNCKADEIDLFACSFHIGIEIRHCENGKGCCVDENDKSDEEFEWLGVDESCKWANAPRFDLGYGAFGHWGRLGEGLGNFLLKSHKGQISEFNQKTFDIC